ncbi:radical SAM protein [Sandaracinus amylolyticus]|uniref:Radical SAM core domain-containing protein n=1 Tax=Sandaracinus amylolyticus TaxID=927083 RepID=A0A0F6W4E9_9BACT|nr:radical SAM protein [Sandaracinus amylolyticus]AKF07021.1 hypothetical protein DB32_004170 [Sandaracinus amylolyticus]
MIDLRHRRAKSAAFDLATNSTARATRTIELWGQPRTIYANANLSIYSAQQCNARCAFCVEELRPASRGTALDAQKTIEHDDARWLDGLARVLDALEPLDPSVSITGGEPSKDARLPRVLRLLAERGARKRTITTNGSGLFDVREGRTVLEWITSTGVRHLNISRAHPDDARNAKLMGFSDAPTPRDLREIVASARAAGTRVRLSCVLVSGAIETLDHIVEYLDFARSLGVDNVVFRQLMKTDPRTTATNHVVLFSDRRRVALEPLLDAISRDARFEVVKQVVGYYYYVEVHRHRGVDVVFEEADLARLEDTKRDGVIHELVFHPNATLASTWQPWDGVLGPPVTPR